MNRPEREPALRAIRRRRRRRRPRRLSLLFAKSRVFYARS